MESYPEGSDERSEATLPVLAIGTRHICIWSREVEEDGGWGGAEREREKANTHTQSSHHHHRSSEFSLQQQTPTHHFHALRTYGLSKRN